MRCVLRLVDDEVAPDQLDRVALPEETAVHQPRVLHPGPAAGSNDARVHLAPTVWPRCNQINVGEETLGAPPKPQGVDRMKPAGLPA